MKGVVCYDSVYGSTKQVAEAIAEQLRAEGHEAVLVSVKDRPRPKLEGDIMFIGSPTRWFTMTKDAKDFVKDLRAMGWKDQPIVMFDTMLGVPEDLGERTKGEWGRKGAAAKMRDMAKADGLSVREEVLHIGVIGMKGPLTATGAQEAREYASQVLASLGKG
ncbi:MAG TPA: flavodoxin domain-containing protein [Methanomassiliicoccales archaeon]|nr:flavodoxin domain-containing protein [Methanomassiliicoccales archaeon]